RELEGSEDILYRLAFSPTGHHLAASQQNPPLVWEVSSGKSLIASERSWNSDLDWSDDGVRLAVEGPGSDVSIFNVSAHEARLELTVPTSASPKAIRWLPNR